MERGVGGLGGGEGDGEREEESECDGNSRGQELEEGERRQSCWPPVSRSHGHSLVFVVGEERGRR